MTEEQARAEAARRNRPDPGAREVVWAPRQRDGDDWEVVKVRVPALRPRRLTPAVGTRPHKPDPGQIEPPAQPHPWWGDG